MKKSTLAMAVLCGSTAMTGVPIANADVLDTLEFEFHGYFRAGYFVSKENDYKKATLVVKRNNSGD
ncbi:hypothetical protein [Enterovibrio coralii]|uniref:hypothetical protein n=1 Tax=Enterovibrio coralii TaxID=294935 RepID=UPI000AF70752|nr:hypothetical protein [Enterovibrio coralii]